MFEQAQVPGLVWTGPTAGREPTPERLHPAFKIVLALGQPTSSEVALNVNDGLTKTSVKSIHLRTCAKVPENFGKMVLRLSVAGSSRHHFTPQHDALLELGEESPTANLTMVNPWLTQLNPPKPSDSRRLMGITRETVPLNR